MSCGCNKPRDESLPRPVYAGEAFRVIQVTKKGTRRVWGWSNSDNGGVTAYRARVHPDTASVVVENEDAYVRRYNP